MNPNNVEDLVDFCKDKLREVKNDIKGLGKVPEKYAYVFEKLIAMQEYTVASLQKIERNRTRVGGSRARGCNNKGKTMKKGGSALFSTPEKKESSFMSFFDTAPSTGPPSWF